MSVIGLSERADVESLNSSFSTITQFVNAFLRFPFFRFDLSRQMCRLRRRALDEMFNLFESRVGLDVFLFD